MYLGIIAITLSLLCIFLIKTAKENVQKCLEITVLVLLLPLAANFIFVMVGVTEVHNLMTFGEYLVPVTVVWFFELYSGRLKFEKLIKSIAKLLLVILIISNVRFSNICYLKAELLQSHAISYYTTLISSIKTADGYDSSKKVVYINEYNKVVLDNNIDTLFPEIQVNPYGLSSIINSYSWKKTMSIWCGYNPTLADGVLYEGEQWVKNMPCYPDKGSIRVCNDVVVVKFAQNDEAGQ